MSKETAIVKTEEKVMEFVPFGSDDKIKLSIAIVKNLVAVKTKSGATCSDNDAIKFMMMCQARRLNPFEGDSFLIGYDGKDGPTYSLITAHQAFLKRAELHPEYNGMKSGVIVGRKDQVLDLEGDFYLEGDTVMGGWATVYFKNREHPMNKRVRLKRFQKQFGIWQEDPAGMIVKCAEADALRSSFPTMLGGLYLREEVEHVDAKVATPIFKTKPAVVDVAPAKSELEQVQELMKKDDIREVTLMEFLQAVGLAVDVDDVANLHPTTLLTVIEQWPEFVARIREVEV